MARWWAGIKPSQRNLVWGVVFIAFSVVITGFLAWRGTGPNPPAATESAALVILSAMGQIAGGWKLARVGHADPNLARSAVRDLFSLFDRVKSAELLAQDSFEQAQGKHREILGRLSVHFGYIGDGVARAAEAWRDVHPEALEDLDKRAEASNTRGVADE